MESLYYFKFNIHFFIKIVNFDFRYNVTWGKQTKKKHKTWEGDGYLIVSNKSATLHVINNNT